MPSKKSNALYRWRGKLISSKGVLRDVIATLYNDSTLDVDTERLDDGETLDVRLSLLDPVPVTQKNRL